MDKLITSTLDMQKEEEKTLIRFQILYVPSY